MPGSSSLTLFRTAALVCWAMIGLATFLQEAPAPPPGHAVAGVSAVLLVRLAAFLAFGGALWWNTRGIQTGRPRRMHIALLFVQIILSLFVSTDLALLVAVQVPIVFSGRGAAVWISIQTLLVGAIGLLAGASEGFEPLPGLDHLPHPVVVALSTLSLLVWQGLAFAVGFLAATQYRSAAEMSRLNAELRATQALLEDGIRAAERRHISRELHDSLGHHLSALSLNLELARIHAAGDAVPPLADAATSAKALLAEVRETVGALRAERAFDLQRALALLVAGVKQPIVHLTWPEGFDVPSPAHAHTIFRCVQEALTNAVRHSGAGHVWVDVAPGGDRLEVHVRDDGRGAAALRAGHGLAGMRERFAAAGGAVELDTAAGGGFRLRGWLPRASEPA